MERSAGNKRCRVCLQMGVGTVSLYDAVKLPEKQLLLSEVLQSYCRVEINKDDKKPQTVCAKCAKQAEQCYRFKIDCEQADGILQSELENCIDLDLDVEVKTEPMLPDDEPSIGARLYALANPALNQTLVDPTDTALIDMLTCNTFESNMSMKIEIDDTRVALDEPIKKVQKLYNAIQETRVLRPKKTPACVLDIKKTNQKRKSPCFGSPMLEIHTAGKTKPKKKSKLESSSSKHTPSAEICSGVKSLKLMCNKCGFETPHKLQLAKHCSDHIPTDDQVHECEHCFELFPDGEKLVDHKSSRHFATSTRFSSLRWCKSCDVVCHNITEYDKHTSHVGAEVLYATQIITFTCSLCPENSGTVEEFRAHKLDKHPNSCNCEDCPEFFWYKQNRTIRLKHETSICEICGFTCDSKNLSHHMKFSHSDTAPATFECPECGKMLSSASTLEIHKRRHRKCFDVCKECGATFTSYYGLAKHMYRHSNKKVYKCTICDGVLKTKDLLNRHMNTHTGEKSFECETCGKSFNNSYNYRIHLSVHTGVKKYVCEICGSAFRVNVSLRTHIAKHHSK